MMNRLIKLLLNIYLRLKRKLEASPRMMQLYQHVYHDIVNKDYFTDWYQHDSMLADTIRVETYYQAITKHVKEGDIVIDLGTGTGILSFFASLKSPKKIYALDHSEIIEIAKTIGQHNTITNIEFVKTYSKHFDSSEKVDVIIQEQIGAWLFNENMIECVLDLRERLLKSEGKILPNIFELYIEPFQCKDIYRIPFVWEHHIHGIDFSCLRAQKERAERHYFHNKIKPYEVEYFLCQPSPLARFNLETMEVDEIPHTLNYTKPLVRGGRLDGFCLYFTVRFDDEIVFTTSPLRKEQSYSSWSIPYYRVESKQLQQGELIEFTLNIPEIRDYKSWRWNHHTIARAEASE